MVIEKNRTFSHQRLDYSSTNDVLSQHGFNTHLLKVKLTQVG